jgi:hypothetical protein
LEIGIPRASLVANNITKGIGTLFVPCKSPEKCAEHHVKGYPNYFYYLPGVEFQDIICQQLERKLAVLKSSALAVLSLGAPLLLSQRLAGGKGL